MMKLYVVQSYEQPTARWYEDKTFRGIVDGLKIYHLCFWKQRNAQHFQLINNNINSGGHDVYHDIYSMSYIILDHARFDICRPNGPIVNHNMSDVNYFIIMSMPPPGLSIDRRCDYIYTFNNPSIWVSKDRFGPKSNFPTDSSGFIHHFSSIFGIDMAVPND